MSGYPLTEPDVMPAMISRLKKMYMISIGMVMSDAAKSCRAMASLSSGGSLLTRSRALPTACSQRPVVSRWE